MLLGEYSTPRERLARLQMIVDREKQKQDALRRKMPTLRSRSFGPREQRLTPEGAQDILRKRFNLAFEKPDTRFNPQAERAAFFRAAGSNRNRPSPIVDTSSFEFRQQNPSFTQPLPPEVIDAATQRAAQLRAEESPLTVPFKSVLPESVWNRVGQVPAVGEELQRVGRPVTSPVGLLTAAVAPGATLAGTEGAFVLGQAGKVAEDVGAPIINTPIGRVGPRTVGELLGSLRAPSRRPVIAPEIQRGLEESGGITGIGRRLASEELGGTGEEYVTQGGFFGDKPLFKTEAEAQGYKATQGKLSMGKGELPTETAGPLLSRPGVRRRIPTTEGVTIESGNLPATSVIDEELVRVQQALNEAKPRSKTAQRLTIQQGRLAAYKEIDDILASGGSVDDQLQALEDMRKGVEDEILSAAYASEERAALRDVAKYPEDDWSYETYLAKKDVVSGSDEIAAVMRYEAKNLIAGRRHFNPKTNRWVAERWWETGEGKMARENVYGTERQRKAPPNITSLQADVLEEQLKVYREVLDDIRFDPFEEYTSARNELAAAQQGTRAQQSAGISSEGAAVQREIQGAPATVAGRPEAAAPPPLGPPRPPAPPRQPPPEPPNLGAAEEAAPQPTIETVTNKVIQTLKEQQAASNIQREARSVEKGARTAEFRKAYDELRAQGMAPEEAQKAAMPTLAGELPGRELAAPLDLAENERTLLWQKVDDLPELGTYNQINARSALLKIETGQPLQNWEIRLLGRIYGKGFAGALRAKKPGIFGHIGELLITPKAVLSSFDLSYPLRQAALAAPAHPFEWGNSFKPMVQAAVSEKGSNLVNGRILSDTRQVLFESGKTAALGDLKHDLGLLRTIGGTVDEAEEVFRSSLAERLPGVGRIVRMSNRAFTTFGNVFRSQMFDTILNTWERRGIPITEQRLQALSNMLNRFTGRGTLSGDIFGHQIGSSRLTNVAQDIMWAPQYRISGPQAVGQLLHPDRYVRAEAWKNMAAYMSVGMATLSAAKLSGLGDVEIDPRSSDFGKIRIGNTRINLWGTNQLLVRTIAQAITNTRKSPGDIFSKPGRADIITRYVRSGLAPEWALLWDLKEGKTYLGEELGVNKGSAWELLKRNTFPLVVQDAINTFQQEGLLPAIGAGALSFFGGGVSSYSPTADQFRALPTFNTASLDTTKKFLPGATEPLNLTANEERQLRDFIGRDGPVQKWKQEQEEKFGPAPEGVTFEKILEYVAKQEGLDSRMIAGALFLHRATSGEDLSAYNPEWVRFALEHEDELGSRFEGTYQTHAIDVFRQRARDAGLIAR